MAKLTTMPAEAIVDAFKGTIDFFYYRGTPVVRKWPHWPKRTPLPDERANQETFTYAARSWIELPEYVKLLYQDMAAGIGLNRRDLFMRCYLSGNRF